MKPVFVVAAVAATVSGMSGCASVGSAFGTDLTNGQIPRSSMQQRVEHKMRTASDEQGVGYLSVEDMKDRRKVLRNVLKVKIDKVTIE